MIVLQVASFVTFAVLVGTGGTLQLSSVFYVVALLHLPKLWLALFFVKGVKASSETRVAGSRINNFLCQLEPHTPSADAAAGANSLLLLPPCVLKRDTSLWATLAREFVERMCGCCFTVHAHNGRKAC